MIINNSITTYKLIELVFHKMILNEFMSALPRNKSMFEQVHAITLIWDVIIR